MVNKTKNKIDTQMKDKIDNQMENTIESVKKVPDINGRPIFKKWVYHESASDWGIENIEYRDTSPIWEKYPVSVRSFLRKHFMEPLPVSMKDCTSEEEINLITRNIYKNAIKDYVKDIYDKTGVRDVTSRKKYHRTIDAIEEPFYMPKYIFMDSYQGVEADLLEEHIHKNVDKMLQNPTKYFPKPELIPQYLKECERRKNNQVWYLIDGERILKPWYMNIRKDLVEEVGILFRGDVGARFFTKQIRIHFKELDLQIYLQDLEKAKKVQRPEIEFSDDWTLRVTHLDFQKIQFEINLIKKYLRLIYDYIFYPIFHYIHHSIIPKTLQFFQKAQDFLIPPGGKVEHLLSYYQAYKIDQFLVQPFMAVFRNILSFLWDHSYIIMTLGISSAIVIATGAFALLLFIDQKYYMSKKKMFDQYHEAVDRARVSRAAEARERERGRASIDPPKKTKRRD